MGPEGSGTALTARLIMDAFGVPSGAVREEFLEFRTAGIRLVEGHLDAMFDNAFYAESAADALRSGARLVTIQGAPVERLGRQYPFLRMTVVPKDTYPQVDVVETIGVDSLLICRSSLDQAVVHQFTKALFDALALVFHHTAALHGARSSACGAIPLHEGAARYYREHELLR